MDFFGLAPEGHPNPTRVALHDDWPDGAWALRKDFPTTASVPRVPGEFHPFRPVTGEGVFQVPVGPVHAGIIEPGHFRFGVAGEPVLYLQLRLFYVHKGIEKRFERLPWRHGALPGRVDLGRHRGRPRAGVRARHRAARRRRRARRARRRCASCCWNWSASTTTSRTSARWRPTWPSRVPASRAQALREGLAPAAGPACFGTRLLRGTVALGGVKRDLPRRARRRPAAAPARDFEREFDDLIALLIDAGTFTDRVDGTGVLTQPGGARPRASSAWRRARRAWTSTCGAIIRMTPTRGLRFEVPGRGGRRRAGAPHGARARGRAVARRLLRQVLDALPDSAVRGARCPTTCRRRAGALGWAEAWRGRACTGWRPTSDGDDRARQGDRPELPELARRSCRPCPATSSRTSR